MSLGGFAQFVNNDRASTLSASPQLSFYTAGVSINSSMRLAWIRPRAATAGGGSRMTAASTVQIAAAPFGGVFTIARAVYDHTTRSLANLDLSASISLTGALALGVSYNVRDLDWKRGTLYSQLSYAFGLARASVGATYQEGEFSAANRLEGGILISSDGVRAAPYEAANQSAVIVNAFHDRNLNGVRDNGEETLSDPGADLAGDAARAHADDGVFLSLTPYQQSTVTISHDGFAALGLYPRKSSFQIYTLPAATTVIDVAYARGFDVTGQGCVVAPGSPRGGRSTAVLTGLRIRLIATDGNAEYAGEMFDDGTLLVEGVSEGSYRIAFDDQQLATRGLRSTGLPERVVFDATTRTLPAITFMPRDAADPAADGDAAPSIDR
jgi:hypothetical protein